MEIEFVNNKYMKSSMEEGDFLFLHENVKITIEIAVNYINRDLICPSNR